MLRGSFVVGTGTCASPVMGNPHGRRRERT